MMDDSPPVQQDLACGAVVVDRLHPAGGAMVVCQQTETLAADYEIDGDTETDDPLTVATYNPGIPGNVPVVEVWYPSRLDSQLSSTWREWLDDDTDFEQALAAHRDEWGVSMPDTYAFPRPRLERVTPDALSDPGGDDDG